MSVRSALERDCILAFGIVVKHQQEMKPGFIDLSLIATSRPWCSTASPYEPRSRVSVVACVVASSAACQTALRNAGDISL